MRDDEAKEIIEAMRAEKAVARRRCTWGKSRLVRHRVVIVTLHRNGASYAEIAKRLRDEHRCKVNRSTVLRYLKSLPEVRDGASA